MLTAKISDSLAELQNDLDAFECAVLEMIKDKEMGRTAMHNSQENSSDVDLDLYALSRTPIAIIGMASLFPESKSTQAYWDNILAEVDCITEVPESRWNSADYFDENPRAVDKTYCKRGGFIPDIDFNPMEFGLPPNVLEATDISQLLALVIARQAMEDSGYGQASDLDRNKTGVVLGAVGRQLSGPLWGRLQYPVWERVLKSSGLSDEDTQKVVEKLKLAYPSWQENSFPGMLSNVISGRIANRLDFGGLNCTLDAACASSLAALKMALSELVERRADVMLTGGVDPDNSAFTYLCFSKTPALSPTQESRPFDQSSKGIMLGEGVGMVVLKRLEDAERDGDRVYAVIRGLGTSSDGRFKSIYAPRPEGQVKAIRRAYEDANIDPATIGLMEAHGTGTVAGDSAEFEGMNAVFGENNPRKQHIALGTVKSQIGHTKTAAGMASMIKASLALHHKILPPTINIDQPNTKFDIEDSPFYLNTKVRPWIRKPDEGPRRAGVSSFGFGGTNFHVVLEEYEAEQAGAYRINSVPQPVLISAATPAELAQRCQALLTAFQGETGEAEYVAQVNESRSLVLPDAVARLGFVAESFEDAQRKLKVAVTLLGQMKQEAWEHPQGIFYRASGLALNGKVVALFSGQGSQYIDMGQSLTANFPPLRETFARHDRLLAADGLQPVSDVVYALPVFDEAGEKRNKQMLRRTEYAQPAIGAFSSGLYKVFQQAGFTPSFTAGHSFGELTALWASGVLNEEDYAFLVKARGQAMAAPAGRDFDAGAMLAVKGDAARIQTIVDGLAGVSIANFNSGQQVVLAGATDAIAAAKTTLEGQGFEPIPLPVSAAFHTPLVGHAQVPFSQAVEQVTFATAKIPVFTNVTGQAYPADAAATKTLLQQHMVSQVQFKQEIENLYAAGGYCFVEFGPKNTLTNLVKDILGDRPHLAIATNASRHKDSDIQMREAAMQLRVAGLSLGDIDPYQLPLEAPVEADPKAKRLMVKINGASFVGKKTQAAFEAALKDGHQVKALASAASPVSSISRIAKAHGYVEGVANVTGNGANGNGSNGNGSNGNGANGHISNGNGSNGKAVNGNGANGKSLSSTNGNGLNGKVTNGNGSNGYHSNGNGSNGNGSNGNGLNGKATNSKPAKQNGFSPVVSNGNGLQKAVAPAGRQGAAGLPQTKRYVQQEAKTLMQPNSHQPVTALEGVLAQFNQHQSQVVGVHEQYLEAHRQYTEAFAQITQQQQQLLAQPGTQDLVASTERNLMAFHAHQQETLRVHEQYLTQQMAFANRFCDLSQAAPAAASESKPVVAKSVAKSVVAKPVAAPVAITPLMVTTPPAAPVVEAPIAPVASPAPVAVPSVPTVAPTPVAQASPETAPTSTSSVDIAPKLLAVVSDKTGYPAEMLELDMDMEADLGIDSIKRVEILGALQEEFPELPQPNLEELAEIEMRTLGQVADYMQSKMGAAPTAETPVVKAPVAPAPVVESKLQPAPVAAPPVATPVVAPALVVTAPAPAASTDKAEMQTKLLDVVSDKTGYPAEMLELDMDMEADLGIDSIKRVEILGALQEAFPNLPQPNLEELAEVEMRTLGQVADYMQGQLDSQDGGNAPTPAAPVTPAPTAVPRPAPVATNAPVAPTVAPVSTYGSAPSRSVAPAAAPSRVAAPVHAAVAVLERPVMAAQAAVATPTVSPQVAVATVVAPQAEAVDATEMQTKLLAVVSDKTGYPAEMLELDMDMEADLGIDSIKRVEILGALQEEFPNLPQPNLEELAEVEMRTLGQVADYMQGQLQSVAAPTVAPVSATPAVAAVADASTAVVTANPADAAEMQTKLLEVVSDKTGYPAEMLELDMDMEADLGIDSIKRVEILGALQEEFPDLPQPNLEELAEVEMRTLGQVANYMQSLRTGEKKNELVTDSNIEPSVSVPETFPGIDVALSNLPVAPLPLPRHPAQLQYLPPADWLEFELPQGHICLLTDDGTETTTTLSQQLVAKGWKVVVLSFPTSLVSRQAALPAGVKRVVLEQLGDAALGQQLAAIAATEGAPAAFIHLHPTGFASGQGLSFPEAEASLVKQVFFLAKHLKTPLNQASRLGRSAFMTVARLDGSFGMGGHGGYSAIAAGLAGLTKTLNFEWRGVFCRALDLNPSFDAGQSVNCILAELHDPDGALPETAYGDRGRVALVAG